MPSVSCSATACAIVFSSEIVTPRMRVTAEPRATTPRQQLDEILAPNGLSAESGPGGVILVVHAHAAAPTTSAADTVSRRHADGAGSQATAAAPSTSYSDHVTVSSTSDSVDTGASQATLDRGALAESGGPLEADGLAAVHAMPRVSALDDFRSDFSVRGSPYRQIGIVIDGVATPWLQHTVYGRSDLGSVSMFGSDSLDRATLQAGVYPRLYDDTLGAQLELTLKEGSRDSTRISGTAGGMTAAVVGEGPIGTTAAARGLRGCATAITRGRRDRTRRAIPASVSRT